MSKTRLEPMGDYLLVADIPQNNTLGEISLPDNQRQQEMIFGFVVAVGPSCSALKEQDRICYGPYAGKNVIIEGIEFRLLREGQIEGKIVNTN
jgi:chaperonin GroES